VKISKLALTKMETQVKIDSYENSMVIDFRVIGFDELQ